MEFWVRQVRVWVKDEKKNKVVDEKRNKVVDEKRNEVVDDKRSKVEVVDSKSW